MDWSHGSDDYAARYLSCATEMLGKGHAGVVIVDLAEGGKAHMPADFALFYLDARK